MPLTELLLSPEAWISLGVLSLMEIVLGIDNIVFITILCGRLPKEKQLSARRLGLAAALITRLMLLSCISWLMHLDQPLFPEVAELSGKDLILMLGGLFLLYKATKEIYENVEHPEGADHEAGDVAAVIPKAARGTAIIVLQIMILDVVFSLDSVITAVGMAEHLIIMATAVIIAIVVMILFAGPVGDFVQDNPSVRVLALAFLVLIGVMLVMEGTGQHVSKGYIYTAMGFSLFVE